MREVREHGLIMSMGLSLQAKGKLLRLETKEKGFLLFFFFFDSLSKIVLKRKKIEEQKNEGRMPEIQQTQEHKSASV